MAYATNDSQPTDQYWLPTYGFESNYHRVGQLNRALVRKKLFEIQDGKCAITGRPLSGNFDIDHIIPFNEAKASGRLVWERGYRKWRWVLYMADGRQWNDITNLRLVLTVVHKRKSNREVGQVQRQMVRDRTHFLTRYKCTKESYELTRSIHEMFASGNMTHGAIASKIGCSRVTVGRALKRNLAEYAQRCGVNESEVCHV